jgi:phosphoenolpyruvate carboxylase
VLEAYPSFDAKVVDALCFTDPDGPLMTDSLREAIERSGHECIPHEEHLTIVRRIRDNLGRGDTAHMSDLVVRAALLRRFLG